MSPAAALASVTQPVAETLAARVARDPHLALALLLSALIAGALGLTGEITRLALAIPPLALLALLWPARAARGRLFEAAFQVVALASLVLFVGSLGAGPILGGAAALTLPVQAHSLLSLPTHRSLGRLRLLAFFQLLGLASSTTQLVFAPVLLACLVLAPLVLTLAALERARGPLRVPVPWARGLWKAALPPSLACAGLGIVVFLALPRYEVGLFQSLAGSGRRVAGFSDTVSLGDITSIQSSDAVVLRVRIQGDPGAAPRWRGKVFDTFTGRAWTVTPEPVLVPRRDGRTVLRERAEISGNLRGRIVVQDVTIEPLRARALFTLASARALEIEPQSFQNVLADAWGNLVRGAEGSRRVRYRVTSQVLPDESELGAAARELFLQLPDEFDPRLRGLAAELAGQADDATRAARIETALQEGWPYSLDVNDRGARDPVARFLLEKAPGHCEYFATAMAVLLRAEGIPSRLVTGFQHGAPSWLFGAQVVRQRDAHAWVEAWIEGQGWTVFDPTPLAGRETGGGSLDVPIWERLEMLWDDNVIGFNYTFQLGFLVSAREVAGDALAAARRHPWGAAGLVAAALALAAAPVGLRWWSRARRQAPGRQGAARTAFQRRAERLLARRGYRRAPGETALELARRACAGSGGGVAGAAAIELARLYHAARFGGAPADPARVRELLAALEALPPRKA